MLICCAETSCAFFVFSSNRKILCHPRNYDLASNSFKKAIDEIDKSIDHPQKPKTHCWAQTETCDSPTTRPTT
jgi:hypothetical protein